MRIRSLFNLWSCLALLITGTVIHWQLRYVETESLFWRDRPLSELVDWRRHEGSLAPKIISTEAGEKVLQFSPHHHQAISINSWVVKGAEKIKVRVRHRSIDPIKSFSDQKSLPVSISVTGSDKNNHLILDRVGHVVSGSSPDSWQTSEVVMPLSERSRRVSFAIIVSGEEGSLQVGEIDLVGVREARWFSAGAIILWILWALWIFRSLRRLQIRPLISLISTLWILGWGGYLVFPRTIDIPRPFFSTFWVSSSDKTQEKIPALFPSEKSSKQIQKQGPAPKAKQAPTDQARKWFESFSSGRFLMHFGVMGVFSGGLLLLTSLRRSWPYLFTMIVGIELLPAIMMGSADREDLVDLLAYVLAVALAIPIAHMVKTRLPQKYREITS